MGVAGRCALGQAEAVVFGPGFDLVGRPGLPCQRARRVCGNAGKRPGPMGACPLILECGQLLQLVRAHRLGHIALEQP